MCIFSCYYKKVVSIFTVGYQLDEHQLFWSPAMSCYTYSVITVYSVYGEINMMTMMIQRHNNNKSTRRAQTSPRPKCQPKVIQDSNSDFLILIRMSVESLP